MSGIKVNRHELRNFKSIVEKNKAEFGDIRQKLSNHLNSLRSTDWISEGAADFAEIFETSKSDILKLEEVMQDFVKTLTIKCDQADRIAMHKLRR